MSLPVSGTYTVSLGQTLRAGRVSAPPPPAPPPVTGSRPTIFIEPVPPGHMIFFSMWHGGGDYTRFQQILEFFPTDESSTGVIPFLCSVGGASGAPDNFLGDTYTLLIDDVPRATTVIESPTSNAEFIAPIGQLSSGWRRISITSNAPVYEPCPTFFMRIQRPGDPEPDLMPSCRTMYDLNHGYENHAWAWVPTRYTPTPVPAPLRDCPNFNFVPTGQQLFVEQILPTQQGTIHRPNVTKDGIWTTFNRQNYFLDSLYRRYPDYPVIDGPRGVGMLAMATHISVDRHGGAIFCTPGGLHRVSETGHVTTRCGYVYDPHPAYWGDNERPVSEPWTPRVNPNLKLRGIWDGIPVERQGFFEIWGEAFDKDSLELDMTAPTQINSIDGAVENPHLSGPRQFIPDSQNDRVLLLTYTRDSFTNEPVVTEFITGMSDPWDNVWSKVTGVSTLYVSERKLHRISAWNAHTGEFIKTVVQRDPNLPGNAIVNWDRSITITDGTAEEIRQQPCFIPEGLYIVDEWLYYASAPQGQVRRTNLLTDEIQVVGALRSSNALFAKIAVSDGTAFPKGTVLTTTWLANVDGYPEVMLPDGSAAFLTEGIGSVPRGKAANAVPMGYSSAAALRDGRIYVSSSSEGLLRFSLLQPGDPIYEDHMMRLGGAEWARIGLDVVYGHNTYGWAGFPLPWKENPYIDYMLEAYGHTPPPKPAWNQGQALYEWREIPNSAMSQCALSTTPPPGGTGTISSILDAGNGLCIDTRTSTLWSLASGGAPDTFANAVLKLEIDGFEASAGWIEVLPSSTGDVVQNAARYTDGRPRSSRAPQSQHFIERRDRAMRFGASPGFSDVEGYDCKHEVGDNGWDAAGTWTPVPASITASTPSCKIGNETVLFFTASAVLKFTPESGTWATINTEPMPADFSDHVCAHESRRNRVLLLRGSSSYVFYVGAGAFEQVTLNGGGAAAVRALGKGVGLIYMRHIEMYAVRSGTAGGSTYLIEAGYWGTEALPTTGGSGIPAVATINGDANVYGKFLWSPGLRCALYVPNFNSNVWALRLV